MQRREQASFSRFSFIYFAEMRMMKSANYNDLITRFTHFARSQRHGHGWIWMNGMMMLMIEQIAVDGFCFDSIFFHSGHIPHFILEFVLVFFLLFFATFRLRWCRCKHNIQEKNRERESQWLAQCVGVCAIYLNIFYLI